MGVTKSYLERYKAGKQEEVWLELTALGPVVRQEPLYSDARAVAQETMARVRQNIETLIVRLKVLNYHFAVDIEKRSYLPLTLPEQADIRILDLAEQTYGLLPISVRSLYEFIANVDLRGSHPTLSKYGFPGWEGLDVQPYSDPLFIAPFDDLEDTVEGISEDEMPHLGRFATFTVMPDIAMKARSSGGLSTAIIFPNSAMDAHFIQGDWPGMLLVSYLRLSFKWGGFAGFSTQPDAAEAAREELAFLTEGLLPI